MATRTVRLDDEAERVLEEVRASTGLPISEALKAGLRSLQERLRSGEAVRPPYEIYRQLDLGPGGYAIAPSTEVRAALRRRLRSRQAR
ncbi:MAG TPA: hypothetical protein VMB48_01770 [Steroidobacteraceae bacterium]|nr:hypothetical protein [Steroidobacteraceae bacterium]